MTIVRRVGMGLLIAFAGAVVFEVPATYAIARGWPLWLAIALGALAFPVVPLAWHVWRERARKQAPPAKSHTVGYERLLLRCAAVALVAIGGLVAIAGGGRVWRALRDHALWFVPYEPGALVADSPLLSHAPANATTIVWLRPSREAGEQLANALPGFDKANDVFEAQEFVLALDDLDRNAWLAGRGAPDRLELLDPAIDKLRDVPTLAPADDIGDDTRVWATTAWSKPAVTKPTALVAMLPRAPDDALVVGAMTGARGNGPLALAGWTGGIGWVRIVDRALEVTGEADFATDAQAEAALVPLRIGLAAAEQNACWSAHGHAALVRTGHTIRVTGSIALAQINALGLCLQQQ